ncbi:MAG TPA: NAD-dependent epimerase/dehydratase family protein [Actinocrinis sp.]|nr:NAD-dependent epimerase/dehydratase family protein [Actinocrinis sp.]
MEIVGRGFLARHLQPLAHRHPDAVALAAGVSSTHATSTADFAREEALVGAAAQRCRETGRRLLFFSTASAALYGPGSGAGREDQPAVPANPYGAHKLALEELLRASGADYLVLRLSHLVGPGQPAHHLLPTLMRCVQNGRVRVLKGAQRDLIAVADAVRIIDLLLTRGVTRETVNVASGCAVPVEAIIGQLELLLATTADRAYEPGGSGHRVCIDKLRALIPETRDFGFGAHYDRRVVESFVSWELSRA